jgi:hypothetical protein
MLAVVSQVESQIAAVRHKDPAAEEGSLNAAHCSPGEHHIPSQVKLFHSIRLGQSVTHLLEGYQQSPPARVQSLRKNVRTAAATKMMMQLPQPWIWNPIQRMIEMSNHVLDLSVSSLRKVGAILTLVVQSIMLAFAAEAPSCQVLCC